MKRIISLVSALIIGFSGFSQTYINENFSTFTDSILPPLASGWKNIDSITPSANQIWRFDNPGGRAFNGAVTAPAAVADGDWYGPGNSQDAYLSSTNFDASLATVVLLQFEHVYEAIGSGGGEVQIFNGSNWITDTIFTLSTDPTGNDIPTVETIDISQYVAGVSNAQVRFRYNDPTWGWYWILDNVTVFQPTPDDAAVVAIDSLPVSACSLDSNETITARVVNSGSTLIQNIPIRYTINGGPIVPETINDSILPGDTLLYSFATKANLSVGGAYNIVVYTSIRGDVNNVNDTAFFTTTLNPAISTFPYSEGFENGNGAWTTGGINGTWAVGAPTGAIINSAANGLNSYVTNPSGQYNNSDASFVLSPCFDFSGLNAPQFKMNIWYESEASWDGAVLEMTIDDGITWNQVGAFGNPNNWYNDNTINGLQFAGLTGEGWTIVGTGSGGWLLAEHDLPTAANQPSVRFRVFHGSDGSVTREGFAFDDILIQDAPATDVGIASFASPVTGCGLSAADSVCVMVANFGSAPINSVPVAYEFNGQLFTDTVQFTLNPGDTAMFCFDSTINIAASGTYNIKSYSMAANDGNALNDTVDLMFDNIPIVSGYPYAEGFENGNGGWVSGGSNNTWTIGTPAKAVINSAANGFNAYVTELTGQYNANEESWVQGPCFDFTSLNQPQFKMNIWWNAEFSWDGAVLQSSIDGGATWQKVGALGDPNNWYTDNSINGLQANLEPSGEGWSGRNSSSNGSGGWVLAEHDLTGLANQPAVILRIAFGSDGSVQDEGIAFDDILILDAPAVDAATFDIVQPNNGCALTASEPLEIRIINQGSDTISNIPAAISFNGITYLDTLNQMMLPGDTAFLLFDSTANMTVSGDYDLTAYTDIIGDGNSLNDTARKTVTSIPVVSMLPYNEDFELGTGGWIGTGVNSSWAHGTPSSFTIANAGQGVQAYVTNLSGNYNVGEFSYLESPCFDFTGLSADPIIRFRMTYQFGFNGDAWLEQSISGGAWTTVVDNGGAQQWYNNTGVQRWDGTSSAGPGLWVVAENTLPGVAGQSDVKFRFVMDGDNFSVGEGIGIDDVTIDLPPAADAGIAALVSPITNCGLGSADSIKVQIKNFGLDTLTTIPVSFEINGGTAVTETLLTSLLPGDTLEYTFTTATANLSLTGSYSIKTFTSVTLDGNSTNDTNVTVVENTLQSAPYLENFDGFTSGTGFNNAGSILGSGWEAIPEVPNFAWGVRTGTTGSGGTGPNDDRTIGGNYVYVEGSNGPTGDSAMLVSPCIDLGGVTNPRLQFWYHKFGANMGDLNVDIYDGTSWFNSVDVIIGQVQTANADTFLLRDTTSLATFAGSIIQVRFRSSGKTGFSTDMAIDDFSVYGGPVSVNELYSSELEFSIYPNPTKGEFTLVAPPSNSSMNVEIVDTKGQLIYNEVMTAASARINTIDVSKVAKGIYFVKISDGNASKVEKLIIQ